MGRHRILLIDDYPAFANSLRLALSDTHDVMIAADASQALEVLGRERFDVLLCDLMMPGISGMELYRRVSERWPGLERRMVFMTGGSFTEEASEFLERTSNPWISKPFPVEALNTAVARALES